VTDALPLLVVAALAGAPARVWLLEALRRLEARRGVKLVPPEERTQDDDGESASQEHDHARFGNVPGRLAPAAVAVAR
jgi:hypothetical protein